MNAGTQFTCFIPSETLGYGMVLHILGVGLFLIVRYYGDSK